ncbi:class I SAM-dependent methyltransferase [Lysobacter sp. SG-8]|uniref:Class I SAM-dependent methyltransferase n=1 Tax=Marilutibacter penaei TaxID=2759900 RepID=A0A7W3YEH2_9GAMM|nr:cyclopropane-fatty-acyl-phospholipid synthase family protein [Lysobacter penaei]MBB1088413.1 class I SAM-dependent methyltransferase [Lysobacter penaei]
MNTHVATPARLRGDGAAPGLVGLAERGWVPDAVLRQGIRRLCAARLAACEAGGVEAQARRQQALMTALAGAPLAIHADAANAQHYEVPAAFFRHCLGPRLKYSACLFEKPDSTLADAEDAMLALYAERAALADGQSILELGCGWGSLTLWMAERYPQARITAVSNSASQRLWIEQACRERGLANVTVLTRDVNALELPAGTFDRCVSVEMFEHVRNHARLMSRISGWLRPGGLLFVHIFAHRWAAYPFETEGRGNWMGRHFFTGGLMPAVDTLLHHQRDLDLEQRWLVDGRHYQRTAEAWLRNQDASREPLMPILEGAYGGEAQARLWFQRWRMFWMACAELFGYDGGQQWLVAHYRFARPSTRGVA